MFMAKRSFNGAHGAQELGFARHHVAHAGTRGKFHQAAPLLKYLGLEHQRIARDDGTLEARAVDAGKIVDRLVVQFLAQGLERKQCGRLRHGLDDQHPGHDGKVRKVSLEERLVDGDILERPDTFAGHELKHAIDEQKRIAVREIFLDFVDIHGTHDVSPSGFRNFLSLSAICPRRRTCDAFLSHSPCGMNGMTDVYVPGFAIDFVINVMAEIWQPSAISRWPSTMAPPPSWQCLPIFALPAMPTQPAIAV